FHCEALAASEKDRAGLLFGTILLFCLPNPGITGDSSLLQKEFQPEGSCTDKGGSYFLLLLLAEAM
ncbi:hypothetical protein STEG23_007186, partial [Scotinomys teguina]